MERIDEQGMGRQQDADHEVAGKADALHLEAGAPRDLHEDGGERDRDAGATVDHLVEVAVAGVVVLVDVAAEAQLLEQVAVERHDRALGTRLVVEPLPERDAHLVEAHQVAADVEVGVLLGRDEQGRLREVQLAVGPREDVLEPATGGLGRIRPHRCDSRDSAVYQRLRRCFECLASRG